MKKELSVSGAFRLGDWVVQPVANTLEHGDQVVRIEPRYMDLLTYLAGRPGEVVSASDILEHVWAGMVVGDQSIYQGIARLRKALGDRSNRPIYIETVPKRGYRLLLSPIMLTGNNTLEVPKESPVAPLGQKNFASWRLLLMGGLLVMIALISILFWSASEIDNSSGTDQSITLAILPFENLDPESEEPHLAYTMPAELLIQLGKADGLRVLGQISSYQFKPGDQDVQEIGQRLGADIVVLGGVHRDNQRIQIYIRLVETDSGVQIWSKRFDDSVDNIFDMETAIANQVLIELGYSPVPSKAAYRTDPSATTLDAYDFYLLGRFHKMNRNKQSLEKALEMYHRAKEIDTEFPAAYRGIATVSLLLTFYGDLPLDKALDTALPNLDRALLLDPTDEEIYGTMGLARYMLGEYGVAEDLLKQAISLNGNYAIAWMWRGMVMEKQGQLRQAIEYYRQAAMLEPLSVVVIASQSVALQEAGKHDKALSKLHAIEDPGLSSVQYNRIISKLLFENGELVAAYRAVQRALAINPDDQMSLSQLALVLRDLEQNDDSLKFFEQSLGGGIPGRGALEYLAYIYIRLDSEERSRASRYMGSLFPDDYNLPEILWLRRTAFLGLSHMYVGRYDQAIKLLESALRAGNYALDDVDFDLLYCTALAFSRRKQDAASDQSVDACEQVLNSIRKQGWDDQWTDYAEIQINILRERYTEAMDGLDALYQRGFNGIGLLENDPLMGSLRQQPRYIELIEKMRHRAATAWAEISSEGGSGQDTHLSPPTSKGSIKGVHQRGQSPLRLVKLVIKYHDHSHLV